MKGEAGEREREGSRRRTELKGRKSESRDREEKGREAGSAEKEPETAPELAKEAGGGRFIIAAPQAKKIKKREKKRGGTITPIKRC